MHVFTKRSLGLKQAPWLMLIILLAFPHSARAEILGLCEVLRLAMKERPFAQAAAHKSEISEYAVKEARSAFFPRLRLTENFYWTNEPAGSMFISLNQQKLQVSQDASIYNDPPDRKDFETRFSLEQRLFDPAAYFNLKSALKGGNAAEMQARWSGQQAAFEAFQAYLKVQQAQAALAWVEAALREAEEIHRLTRERWQNGAALKADLLRAEVLFNQARQRHLSAGNDYRIARQALGLAVGRSGEEVSIGAPIEECVFMGDGSSSVDARADLQALQLQIKSLDMQRRSQRSAYLPTLAMGASYAFHDDSTPFGTQADSWAVNAGLTWELFSGFQRSSRISQAVARQKALQAQWREARLQAEFKVSEAQLRLEEALLNLESTRTVRTTAEESRRLMRERYEAGLTRFGDLLEVQKELDQARFAEVRADSALLLAYANLLFQKGIFLEVLLSGSGDKP